MILLGISFVDWKGPNRLPQDEKVVLQVEKEAQPLLYWSQPTKQESVIKNVRVIGRWAGSNSQAVVFQGR